ncbi:MAG: hypothetical protein PCFJNLEI_00924 [Verrucomicrobiae bacterium]|nr:hypothetical protein [Verrucomicrobiae bacterium]
MASKFSGACAPAKWRLLFCHDSHSDRARKSGSVPTLTRLGEGSGKESREIHDRRPSRRFCRAKAAATPVAYRAAVPLKLVLDTCILKLATLRTADNPAALIIELGLHDLVELWTAPAILEEYTDVLADESLFLAELAGHFQVCYPLTALAVIRHEPDNRFLECALAVNADYLITVNTAKGHFDQRRYGEVCVITPGRFINLTSVQPLIHRLS